MGSVACIKKIWGGNLGFRGSYVALITPFDHGGKVDIPTLEGLLYWHLEAKTDGLVLCGSTGEGATLSSQEKLLIFQTAKKIVGEKIPLIGATTTNVTEESVFLTEKAKKIGIDASLAIIPYYLCPTPDGCLKHFEEIAKVGLPLIVYHHPGRTGIKLSAKELLAICNTSNVVGIKDATKDLHLAMELVNQVPLFSGDDCLALAQFSIGFKASISIIGNVVPKEWKNFVDLSLQGNFECARDIFFSLYPLIQAMTLETNPQCVKYALSLLNQCLPKMRLPLIEPKEENQNTISQALNLVFN